MKIIIIGAGGFGLEVAWVCRRAGLEVLGFCDDDPAKQSGSLDGIPLLGNVEDTARTLGQEQAYHVAAGSNKTRKALAERADRAGWRARSVTDPSAIAAPCAVVGEGSYIGAGCVISRGARLGRHVLVNHQCTVGHDALIADFGQLCPGARLSGECRMGEGALMGSNAVTIPGRTMGAWSVLGAGSVLLRDLDDGRSSVRL